MAEEHWQIQIFAKSLKKKEKLKLLDKNLSIDPCSLILDLGCAQGILSYFLRKKGGIWISADQDFVNLKTTQSLFSKNLIQVKEGPLPFRGSSLDKVVSLDYLEHLDNDKFCLEEIQRVLKREGQIILATPRSGNLFLLHKLRHLLGLKLEFYGHKREGYRLKDLKKKIEMAGMTYIKHKTFSGAFTEFIELALNFLYIKLSSPPKTLGLRDGHIRPSTSNEFQSKQKTFKIYSVIYPFLWLITRLDKLFFFQRSYGLLVWAKKPIHKNP